MDESPRGWQGMERWIERLGICLLNGRLPLPLPFSLLNESQFYSVSSTREETSPSPGTILFSPGRHDTFSPGRDLLRNSHVMQT